MSKIKPVLLGSIKRIVFELKGKKSPLIAGHKLLYSCNLRCRMCPFWRRKDERLLSIDEEVLMMKALEKAGVIFLGLEGGEPLLRQDLEEILYEANRRFFTSLVTNGWQLKNRIKSIRKYLDYLFVSIDGIGEVHDKIRGINGSFNKAVEGIREAVKYVPVSISFTLTNENFTHVTEVIKLAKKLGISVSIQIAYNYSTAEKLSPNKDRLLHTLNLLIKLKEKDYPIVESVEYFKAIKNSWYNGIIWKCKPWMLINIDPQGRIVLPCYVLNEYHGEKLVWEVNIIELWNSFPWEKYEKCNKCALACYLEPSLFSWANLSMVNERIVKNIMAYFHNLFNISK